MGSAAATIGRLPIRAPSSNPLSFRQVLTRLHVHALAQTRLVHLCVLPQLARTTIPRAPEASTATVRYVSAKPFCRRLRLTTCDSAEYKPEEDTEVYSLYILTPRGYFLTHIFSLFAVGSLHPRTRAADGRTWRGADGRSRTGHRGERRTSPPRWLAVPGPAMGRRHILREDRQEARNRDSGAYPACGALDWLSGSRVICGAAPALCCGSW